MTQLYLTIKPGEFIINDRLRSVICPFCETSTNRELDRTYSSIQRNFSVAIFWCEHCSAIAAVNNRIEPVKNDDLVKKYPTISLIPGMKYYAARLLYIKEFAVPYRIEIEYDLQLSASIGELIKSDIQSYMRFGRLLEQKIIGEQKHGRKIKNVTLFDTKHGLCTFVKVKSRNLSNPLIPYPTEIDFYGLSGEIFLSFGKTSEIGSISFTNNQMSWFHGSKSIIPGKPLSLSFSP